MILWRIMFYRLVTTYRAFQVPYMYIYKLENVNKPSQFLSTGKDDVSSYPTPVDLSIILCSMLSIYFVLCQDLTCYWM